MCGIAGLIGRLDERAAFAVDAMSCALEHRGPDGAAVWTSEPDGDGWGCVLGHRRLSVLDLTSAADQPMTSPVTGRTLVYNGELYDYRRLGAELSAAGEVLRSTGDTEVVLRLLDREGVEALPRLRGMFALAAWDPTTRSLLLARDPLGIKPLYVAVNPDRQGDWSLAFASELRALLRSGLVPPRLDPAAVASVVWNGFVTGPGTAIRGVRQLDAGAWRRVHHGRNGLQEHQERFWSPSPRGTRPPSTLDDVAAALRDSVAQHLVSDVPLGVFLSSGVDSSAVANLAQAALDRPLRTFTLVFEEQEHSEGPDAAAIAAAIGTDHTEITLTSQDFRDGLQRAVAALDSPTFDGLNSLHMSRAVKDAGLTVALVGTGGDELFGGYTTFRDLPRLQQGASWLPSPVRRAAARAAAGLLARGARGEVPPQTRWAKLPQLLRSADDLLALYQLSYALFLPAQQRALLRDGVPLLVDGLDPSLGSSLRADIAGLPALPALSRLEQRLFLGERLLRDSDAVAMSVSLELRLPLVDARLTEVVEGLPDALRYAPVGRKQVLRDAGLSGLDAELLERPKRGFVLPYDRWLRGPLGSQVAELLHDRAAVERAGLDPAAVAALWRAYADGAPGLYWSRVWALYVLVAWSHQHGVHI
ncbi:MAG: Asparagine synthase, glutamine-hydrolyzing [Frankiales bacterium]|nr:Asparagine synthase, glutamine-hydrolyzing [Frankiales bacterium]